MKKVSIILTVMLMIVMCIFCTGCANTQSHTVQPGESWWSIAQQYGITDDELAAMNGRSKNEMLYVGDVLRVPAPTTTTSTSTPESMQEYDEVKLLHCVKDGENLSQIARYYSEKTGTQITVQDILQENPQIRNPDIINGGKYIEIPIE